MNTGAIAPNTTTQTNGSGPSRAESSDDAFAAALRGAMSGVAAGSSGSSRVEQLFAHSGTNRTQDSRGSDAAQDRYRGVRERDRNSKRGANAGAGVEGAIGEGVVIGMLTPEAAAAALLVSPTTPSPLHDAAPRAGSIKNGSEEGIMESKGAPDAARPPAGADGGAADREDVPSQPLPAPPAATATSNAPGSSPAAASPAPSDETKNPGPGTSSAAAGAGAASPGSRGQGASVPASPVLVNEPVPAAASRPIEGSGSARASGPINALSALSRVGAPARGPSDAARAQVAPRLMRAEDDGVTGQVARGLASALRQRSGSITLRLNPEALGQVRIDLRVDGNSVRAKVVAAGDDARTLLSRDEASLRGALEARGLKVEHLQIVSLEQDRAEAAAARAEAAQSSPGHTSAWTGGAGQQALDREPQRGATSSAGSGAGSSAATAGEAGASAVDGLIAHQEQTLVWEGSVLRLDAIA